MIRSRCRNRSIPPSRWLSAARYLFARPARAEDADRALLATFCDPADIDGSACTKAKSISERRHPRLRRQTDRGSPWWPIRCRGPPAPGDQLRKRLRAACDGRWRRRGVRADRRQDHFPGISPGSQVNDCVVVPKGERQDRLACLTGHMGQGFLASGVALDEFYGRSRQGHRHRDRLALDRGRFHGAYGANSSPARKVRNISSSRRSRPGRGRRR